MNILRNDRCRNYSRMRYVGESERERWAERGSRQMRTIVERFLADERTCVQFSTKTSACLCMAFVYIPGRYCHWPPPRTTTCKDPRLGGGGIRGPRMKGSRHPYYYLLRTKYSIQTTIQGRSMAGDNMLDALWMRYSIFWSTGMHYIDHAS